MCLIKCQVNGIKLSKYSCNGIEQDNYGFYFISYCVTKQGFMYLLFIYIHEEMLIVLHIISQAYGYYLLLCHLFFK